MSNSIIKLFQIDAFTSEIFKGNPACVMPLENWLSDDILLKIAKENNVSETAFFIKKDDHFYLRWFTPEIEMDLCGHATLATAYCLKEHLNYSFDLVKFDYIQLTDFDITDLLQISLRNLLVFYLDHM